MEKTIVRRKISHSADLSGFGPLLTRIYGGRGVTSVQDVDRSLRSLLPFDSLADIDKACARLIHALKHDEHIVIVGDYDVDGATSTALMIKALQQFGCQSLDFIVPNRFEFGYGLSPALVDEALKSKPDLLITVDNGISSHDGVKRALEHKIDVIITDHHCAGPTLPEATAVVNPNRDDDHFPSKCLAGVGVAFYVMVALRAKLREQAWFNTKRPEPNLSVLLDLVALGTVADIVPLDRNNRVMVHQGLQRIRAGQACVGIKALLQVAGKPESTITSTDLGFVLGPRLNAAGRLEDISVGIHCLLEQDQNKALLLAAQLNDLNEARKKLQKEMKSEADKIVKTLQFNHDDHSAFTLYQPHWHQGIVGLIASKLKDKLNRPVMVFAKANTNTSELKGSGRSIQALHLRDVLAEIATQHPDLILKFGGHAMAAGLSIDESSLGAFEQAFEAQCADKLSGICLEDKIETDGPLLDTELNCETAEVLSHAGPWGQGFPEPRFDNTFTILDQRLVGERHLKLILQPEGSHCQIEAIAFYVDLKQWPCRQTKRIGAVYQLDVNRYCGRSRLQLILDYFYKKD